MCSAFRSCPCGRWAARGLERDDGRRGRRATSQPRPVAFNARGRPDPHRDPPRDPSVGVHRPGERDPARSRARRRRAPARRAQPAALPARSGASPRARHRSASCLGQGAARLPSRSPPAAERHVRGREPACDELPRQASGRRGTAARRCLRRRNGRAERTSAPLRRLQRERPLFPHPGRPRRTRLALRRSVRERLARLIEAPAERVALTSSTTDGCNIVVSGLDLGPDDEVVTTDSEHPGLLLPLHVSGARVRVAEVAARPTAGALDAILSCVTPRTRLLALSHVLWTTGQIMPVHELKRGSGLPVLVDGAQSVGAIPVTVGDLDYYTVSCQKWLCGPDPLGALYVCDPEQLRIALPSYFAQKSIERDGSFVPREGAARFDSGWLAPPALAGLAAALDDLPEWRFDRAAEITERCRSALGSTHELIGESRQGTLVSFVPPGDPADTAGKLYDAGVIERLVTALGR